jgi:hypothetical protein
MPDSVQPHRAMTAATFRVLLAEGRAPRIAGAETPEGQGDSGSTPGVFDSYLQTVPEDGRETVAGYLKDAERTVNGRLSEAAQLKETWGPYEQHLADYREKYTPEELAQILAWHQQVSTDQDAYQQWLTEQARQAGLIEAQQAQEDPEAPGDLTREEIQKLIDQQAQERLQPLQERLEAWETERLTDQQEQQIRSELGRLEGEHKMELTKDQQATVIDLGMGHEGDDWVQAGFERFREITAAGQRLFIQQAQAQPTPPLAGGGAEALKPPTSFKEAGAMARERFRAEMKP